MLKNEQDEHEECAVSMKMFISYDIHNLASSEITLIVMVLFLQNHTFTHGHMLKEREADFFVPSNKWKFMLNYVKYKNFLHMTYVIIMV